MDASTLIDLHGGPSVFAAKVGHRPGAVRVWKHRNRFPREAWPEILQAVPEITLDFLMQIEAASPAPEPERIAS
jgi:hypothetical protein